MASQEGKVRFIIEAKDNATLQIREIANGLKWLESNYTKAAVAISAASAAVSAAFAILGKAAELMNIGAEALRAEEAFGAMAESIGVDAAKMTEAMKKAAGGFVDDSHLMQKAAFAMASDIEPDKIPQLFEAARLAARLTGKDVVDSIDGIIQAVSTNMPRSLRQMGMITKEQMAVLNQAAAAGVTEVNLLDIVLANAAIKSAMLGDSQDNAAKQIKKFKVELEELKETLGKTLIVAAQKAFGAFQWLASGVLAVTAAIPKFMEMVSRLSAFVNSKTGNKEMAAAALRDAAQMESIYNDMMGAAGELAAKGAANMSGTAGEKGRSADPDAAAKAKAALQRIMDDLKKRIAAAKGGGDVDRIREEWAKIERDLSADIAKGGLGEFERKIIDIDKRVEELKVKAAKLPTETERKAAGGNIESWAVKMKDQVEADELQKDVDALLAAEAEGRKALEDLDRSLTKTRSSELQKRLNDVDETAKKETELAAQALLRRVISEEEYAAKIQEIAAVAADAKKKIQADYGRSVREAEINARLADLDLLEKEGLAHRETLAERIELTKELIRAEEEHLATMDKGQDEAGWYAQSDKVNAARKTYADLTREMAMTRPFGALKLSMDDVVNRWTDAGQQMYDVATSTAQAMQQAFSDFFFDTFQGKLKSLGDYVNSFLTSVQRAVANALSQQMSAGIGGLINAGVGALFGGGKVEGYHNGGVVGETAPTFYRVVPSAAFAGARRMHDGWLGADEVPAILQKGEWVLSRRDVAAMKAAATGAPNVAVNIINQSGTPLSGSQQGSPRFDGKKWVLDIVVEGLDR